MWNEERSRRLSEGWREKGEEAKKRQNKRKMKEDNKKRKG